MNENKVQNQEPVEESSLPEIPWEAMLCYLPVFCIYPWTIRREMPEIAGHARQGMILFMVELGLFLITVPTFYKLVWLGVLVIAGLGIWAAYNGRPFRLPIITDLAEKMGAVRPEVQPEPNGPTRVSDDK